MVTSSFWLWAAQRSFYLKHVRVSTVRRATVVRWLVQRIESLPN